MADYPSSDIVDIILILGECRVNYRAAAALYRIRYPDRRHPNHTTIRNLVLRARNGHLARQRRHHDYDENDVRVLIIFAIIHINPRISSRQIERETNIPRRTVLNILKKRRYHAFHITLTQALTQNDFRERLRFCRWALQMIQRNPNFFRYVLFSDESTFKSNGQLNRHNSVYWSDVNPHWFRAVDNQHRWSLMVWCGIINGYLIGPYFFDGNVTKESFLMLLRDNLPGLLEDVDLDTRQRMWIQLDGAPPHHARIVRTFLNDQYPSRWIGRTGPIAWPARSPDLTAPDFYLWGYLKDIVFAQQPTTRENMMERIRVACAAIPRNVLLTTLKQFKRRINLCARVNGATFEQFLR